MQTIRILLLEDDPADARLVSLSLARVLSARFEITHVDMLIDAMDRLEQGGFDIILADLGLPDSAGLSTLHHLVDKAPDLPVVILTGNDDDQISLVALKQGAQDYLVKGETEPAMLARVIRHAIERKISERALKQARDIAEAAVRARSVFLATVGHEIRTPLNGILGMSELLLQSGLDVKQTAFAETIHSSGELLLALVNDILDFSRLEAEGLSLESLAFDLIDLVDEIRLMLAPRAAEKGLTLACKFSPNLPDMVMGDPVRLRQVLLNLVGNALKFTESGGVSIHVGRATLANADGPNTDGPNADPGLMFSVVDTGIGIAEDAKASLFEEFVQADTSISRRFGGTGLGLAISRRLVHLMGGQIGMESNEGEGSRFWFTLPLVKAEIETFAEPPIFEEQTPPSRRILLVDDNRINREVALGLLSRHGQRVVTVESGADAVSLLAAGGFDLVLLDMHMPGMDGFQTAMRMRSLPSPAGEVPIWLLTANPTDVNARSLRDAGIDGCIPKPFRVEHIKNLLYAPRREIPPTGIGRDAQSLLALPDFLADQKDLGRDAMRRLVNLFQDSAKADVDAVRAALSIQNFSKLADHAHRLASSSASLHLMALHALSRQVEDAARLGTLDSALSEQVTRLESCYQQSLATLQEVMD